MWRLTIVPLAALTLAACGGTTIYNSQPGRAVTSTTTTVQRLVTPGGTTTITVPAPSAQQPMFTVPAGFSYLGNDLYATSSTSEPFGQAIYNAYVASGDTSGSPIDLGQVYSPVTNQSYDVQCSSYGSNTGILCSNTTTGNQAQVVFANPS